tara:strand:- start:696 stop:863 length:168 start_codon:yes stop_codon:yes gene_type:complete
LSVTPFIEAIDHRLAVLQPVQMFLITGQVLITDLFFDEVQRRYRVQRFADGTRLL